MKQEKSPYMAAIPEGNTVRKGKAIPNVSDIPLAERIKAKERVQPVTADIPNGNGAKAEPDVQISESDVPETENVSSIHISGLKGLDKRHIYDSGRLSESKNITMKNYPIIESEKKLIENSEFKIVLEEGGNSEGIGEVYDVAVRGDSFFITCEKGHVVGRIDNGNVRYAAIGTRGDNSKTGSAGALIKLDSVRSVYAVTYETDASVMSEAVNIYLYGNKNYKNSDKYMPQLPWGSLEFTENFIEKIYDGTFDKSKIYIVCDDTGKADEVWRYKDRVKRFSGSSSTVDAWIELRRNIYLNKDDNRVRVGYYPVDGTNISQESHNNSYHSAAGNMIAFAGYYLCSIGEEDSKDITVIEDKLYQKAIQKNDKIAGEAHYLSTLGNSTISYSYRPGIFNFTKTVAPCFDSVIYYKGRVFGATRTSIIASEYNKPNGWDLDTTDNISSSHAWMSMSTAGSNADGNITALCEYMGRIALMKETFFCEVYGGSNPFTIQDVYQVGTPFRFGVTEAAGRMCFVSRGGIRVYSGSFPRSIGDETGIDTYTDAVLGGDDRYLYACFKSGLYVYDFLMGLWTELAVPAGREIFKFLRAQGKIYAVTCDGRLLTYGENYDRWSFATDYMSESTLVLKRLQRLRITYELGAGAWFNVKIDTNGQQKTILTRENSTTEKVKKRCEISLSDTVDCYMMLVFEGEGFFRLVSIDADIRKGGDMHD